MAAIQAQGQRRVIEKQALELITEISNEIAALPIVRTGGVLSLSAMVDFIAKVGVITKLAWVSSTSLFENVLMSGRNETQLLISNYHYPLTIKRLLPLGEQRKGIDLVIHNQLNPVVIDGGPFGANLIDQPTGENAISHSIQIRLLDVRFWGALEIQSS